MTLATHVTSCGCKPNAPRILKKKRKLEAELALHKARAKRAYEELKKDTQRAQEDQRIVCLCFDLQQALPTPHLSSGSVFYKRQLYTYNFCIHDVGTGEACMYMWSESTAGRGSEEMASCLVMAVEDLTERQGVDSFFTVIHAEVKTRTSPCSH